jgi:hypothetical protein
MSTVLNLRGAGFLEVAENFFFFECGFGPPLETVAETWKNAANVGAARLLRIVHAGADSDALEKTTRDSKRVILTGELVAVASGDWPQISSLSPLTNHDGAPSCTSRLQALWKADGTRWLWSGGYGFTLP